VEVGGLKLRIMTVCEILRFLVEGILIGGRWIEN
jgi:hypothetical protein